MELISKNSHYNKAGVNISNGDFFTKKISEKVGQTFGDKLKKQIGGFSGLYPIDDKSFLATGTDGVGTKIKLAQELGIHSSIGIDLVAMCVNDVICCGANPLFFLDYMALGKLELETSEALISGIINGCKESDMLLLGGETAEMPDLYKENEYDLAGFCVGQVEKSKVISGANVIPGDSIVGLKASGFHSNGYSLLRKYIGDQDIELKKELLTPTKIYVKYIKNILNRFPQNIKGMAHITGSGLQNIKRINPNFGYSIHFWPSFKEISPIFSKMINKMSLPIEELYNTFNMGVGMVIITDSPDQIIKALSEENMTAWKLGEVNEDQNKIYLNI